MPNRNGNNRGGDDSVDTIAWIIDIGMIFVWFPVGLFLTIANANGHNFVGDLIRSIRKSMKGSSGGANSEAARAAYHASQSRTTSSRVGQPPVYSTASQAQDQAGWTPKQTAGKKDKEKTKESDGIQHADKGAKAREIAGWIVGALGILATIGSMGDGLWSVLSSLAIVLGGGALLWSARVSKRKEAAFKRCFTVSGDKGIVKIKNLASTLGMSEEELEKQLAEMIDRGYYGERAYIDHARGLLVIQPEQMRDVYQAEDEAKAAARSAESAAAARGAMTEYDKILEQIEEADEKIADEVMSAKIRTMRELTAAIFQEVEEHPSKKPQIQRFMNYYLPTTLKLLDSYARIEAQGVSGENMAKAKADIERIADTLVEGYRKQLDTLYRAEAVDIAGDVSVIENMMRRDGLTGQNDFSSSPFQTGTAAASGTAAAAGAAGTAASGAAAAAAPASEEEGQVLGGH